MPQCNRFHFGVYFKHSNSVASIIYHPKLPEVPIFTEGAYFWHEVSDVLTSESELRNRLFIDFFRHYVGR